MESTRHPRVRVHPPCAPRSVHHPVAQHRPHRTRCRQRIQRHSDRLVITAWHGGFSACSPGAVYDGVPPSLCSCIARNPIHGQLRGPPKIPQTHRWGGPLTAWEHADESYKRVSCAVLAGRDGGHGNVAVARRARVSPIPYRGAV